MTWDNKDDSFTLKTRQKPSFDRSAFELHSKSSCWTRLHLLARVDRHSTTCANTKPFEHGTRWAACIPFPTSNIQNYKEKPQNIQVELGLNTPSIIFNFMSAFLTRISNSVTNKVNWRAVVFLEWFECEKLACIQRGSPMHFSSFL